MEDLIKKNLMVVLSKFTFNFYICIANTDPRSGENKECVVVLYGLGR